MRSSSRASSGMGVSRDSRYDDDAASEAGSFYDMNKIRVKVGLDCRGVVLSRETGTLTLGPRW